MNVILKNRRSFIVSALFCAAAILPSGATLRAQAAQRLSPPPPPPPIPPLTRSPLAATFPNRFPSRSTV